jgi:glyoxylase-like metal-dependent hydrolase (beta-lactamase superfamily II)
MCEEILPDLFRIKVPLPASPLKYLNAYVIKDAGRSLIIDTGLNRQECLAAMQAGLNQLGVSLLDADIFITHLHADHFGLVTKLAADSTVIYFSRPDKEIIEAWEGFEPMIAFAGRNGFPEEEMRAAVAQHPATKYGSDWVPELSILEDGDQIHYGKYRFRCVSTPGHTMGHICLYDPEKKILVAGDHILLDITPNIQCWSDEQNPLKFYLSQPRQSASARGRSRFARASPPDSRPPKTNRRAEAPPCRPPGGNPLPVEAGSVECVPDCCADELGS